VGSFTSGEADQYEGKSPRKIAGCWTSFLERFRYLSLPAALIGEGNEAEPRTPTASPESSGFNINLMSVRPSMVNWFPKHHEPLVGHAKEVRTMKAEQELAVTAIAATEIEAVELELREEAY
jgi:hypothetical protein